MDNYIKSTELWIDTMKVQLKQKQDNLAHVRKQIKLWEKESELLTAQITHDQIWLSESIKEFRQYKKQNNSQS